MGANPIGSATPRRGTAIKEAESRPATESLSPRAQGRMAIDGDSYGRTEIGGRFLEGAENRALMMGSGAYLRTLDLVDGAEGFGRSK